MPKLLVIGCVLIWAVATAWSVQRMSRLSAASFRAPAPPSSLVQLAFRACCCTAWLGTLLHSYLDSNFLEISHRGRTASLRHGGRFITFTLWCNCVLALYWMCAAALSVTSALGVPAPFWVSATALITWEIAFPLSWLVAIIVSYVLIPVAMKKEPHKVEILLRWRPQVLHNGYVLACTVEMLLSAPPLVWEHFPIMILFGTTYLAFAWCA
ncbi:hypothetical protein T492DRAFT_834836 [Pavlovales sp. CCMP2436]|nr:hypothetical protein T492DRAFT_834836 [Pavlovales sp. CCMP2436]